MNIGVGGTANLDIIVAVTSAMRTGDYTFYIDFSHDIGVIDESWIFDGGIETAYTVAAYSIFGKRLNITTNEVTDFLGFNCTIHESVIYGQAAAGVRKLVPQTWVSVQGAVPDTSETFPTLKLTSINMGFKSVVRSSHENSQAETFITDLALSSATMGYVRVNSVPV
jgi:hypothetical protein